MGEEINVKQFLGNILDQTSNIAQKPKLEETKQIEGLLEAQEELVEHEIEGKHKGSKQPLYGIVGERVDLPILNYAPLNEKGVILLFGYYLQDLGISHVEEIKAGFPDAIAMRSIGDGTYQRVRIEFEFKSSSFVKHGHDIGERDLIVCWVHDWHNCPIEVIELSTALFGGEKDGF